MISNETEIVQEKAKQIEDNFSYKNYEVARNELFANLRLPSVTIRKDSITFSQSCINKLDDVVYIKILVNRTDKQIAILKCNENDKHAQRWCVLKAGKRKSRKITGKEFSSRVYDLMGWDRSCRYKMLGYKIYYEGEELIVFILNEYSAYKEHKRKTKAQVLAESESTGFTEEQIRKREAEERKMARKPFYPDDWLNTFGVPVEEHHNVEIPSINLYNSFDENHNNKKV